MLIEVQEMYCKCWLGSMAPASGSVEAQATAPVVGEQEAIGDRDVNMAEADRGVSLGEF